MHFHSQLQALKCMRVRKTRPSWFLFSIPFSLQYLEMRFDRRLRLFGSIMFSIMNVCKSLIIGGDSLCKGFPLAASLAQVHENPNVREKNMIWITARNIVAKMTTQTKRPSQNKFLLLFSWDDALTAAFHLSSVSLSSNRHLRSKFGVQSSHGGRCSHYDLVCRHHLRFLYMRCKFSKLREREILYSRPEYFYKDPKMARLAFYSKLTFLSV